MPAGNSLRLVVEADGQWVALLLWGSAAYRLLEDKTRSRNPTIVAALAMLCNVSFSIFCIFLAGIALSSTNEKTGGAAPPRDIFLIEPFRPLCV